MPGTEVQAPTLPCFRSLESLRLAGESSSYFITNGNSANSVHEFEKPCYPADRETRDKKVSEESSSCSTQSEPSDMRDKSSNPARVHCPEPNLQPTNGDQSHEFNEPLHDSHEVVTNNSPDAMATSSSFLPPVTHETNRAIANHLPEVAVLSSDLPPATTDVS